MRLSYIASAISLSCAITTQAAQPETAQTNTLPKHKYNEPTRGFFIEHGNVARNGQASVELHSGSDTLNSGGGIRLGLPKAELIFNSGLNDSGYDENEVLVKWGMPALRNNDDSKTPVTWALTGAVSHTDIEDNNGNTALEQTNLKLGVAATINADAATFTIAPQLIYADSDVNAGTGQKDDTFVEVGLGGYVGVIDTQAGLFSLGAEAVFTTEDDEDNSYAFGGRWLYNKHINLDIIPVVFSDGDLLGVPGLVRLNVAF